MIESYTKLQNASTVGSCQSGMSNGANRLLHDPLCEGGMRRPSAEVLERGSLTKMKADGHVQAWGTSEGWGEKASSAGRGGRDRRQEAWSSKPILYCSGESLSRTGSRRSLSSAAPSRAH